MRLKYILDEGLGTWWACNDVTMYYCWYALSAYHKNYYQELSIPFVGSMHRAVAKRQAEYLAGRYCAKKALTQIDVDITELRSGKHREPLWPEGIVGSITHSNEMALACVSRNKNIAGLGVDLEEVIQDKTVKNIQGSVLTKEDEVSFSTSTISHNVLFTLIFSLKESFFKAAFPQVNRYFDFDAISIVKVDEVSSAIHFNVNYDLSEHLLKGKVLSGKYHIVSKTMISTYVALRNLPG